MQKVKLAYNNTKILICINHLRDPPNVNRCYFLSWTPSIEIAFFYSVNPQNLFCLLLYLLYCRTKLINVERVLNINMFAIQMSGFLHFMKCVQFIICVREILWAYPTQHTKKYVQQKTKLNFLFFLWIIAEDLNMPIWTYIILHISKSLCFILSWSNQSQC